MTTPDSTPPADPGQDPGSSGGEPNPPAPAPPAEATPPAPATPPVTPPAPPATPPTPDPEPAPPAGGGRSLETLLSDLPDDRREAVLGAVREARSEAATYRTRARDAETRLTDLETSLSTATGDAMRLRVALRKGLNETQAKRLVGDSEEDLEKDADDLLASFGTGGQRTSSARPREALRPGGGTPEKPPVETDPTKIAERLYAPAAR